MSNLKMLLWFGLYLVVAVTMPVWIIPYIIYVVVKEHDIPTD